MNPNYSSPPVVVARGVMLILAPAMLSLCPAMGIPPVGHPIIPGQPADLRSYRTALAALDFLAVKEDLRARLTNSDPEWPADWGNCEWPSCNPGTTGWSLCPVLCSSSFPAQPWARLLPAQPRGIRSSGRSIRILSRRALFRAARMARLWLVPLV